ncbi:MAG: hypothetical protein HZC51_06765 [Nitrospirae bacterium]|nr:hypothetical protein [Nitrospirota bacterium]
MGNEKNNRLIDLIMKAPSPDVRPLIKKLSGVRKTTLLLVLAVLALPGVVLSLGFVHLVGTQKLYCLNCHVNQRDQNFWQKSALHPDINCATCHDVSEPGLMAAAFHFRFSAREDLVSERCLGCHKDDLDKIVGVEAASSARPANERVRMPHQKHIGELGIKCTYCHYNIFHERRPAGFATYRPTMDTCYTCHDEKTTSCGMCHPNGMPTGVSMSGKVGGGRITYAVASAGDVSFDHKKHMSKGLTCDSCHDKAFKMTRSSGKMTMAAMFSGKGCGTCHNGKGAFPASDCGRCHMGGAKGGGTVAYNVEGFGPVRFSHDNHMGMGMKCQDCHTALFGFKKTAGKMTMDKINNGKYCGSCHNGKKAFAADACDSCHVQG